MATKLWKDGSPAWFETKRVQSALKGGWSLTNEVPEKTEKKVESKEKASKKD